VPRNTSGSYSLPSTTNPVLADTNITTTWANGTLGDLAAEVTDSLSRSGKGGMSAPIRTPDGDEAYPAHSFTNEPGMGWYRSASGVLRAALSSVWRVLINSAGMQVNGTFSATGNATVGGTFSATGRIDRPSLPVVGQQISASSGTFTRSLNSRAAVTNLTATITTTGRPVMLFLQPDGSANLSQFGVSGSDNIGGARFYLVRTDDAVPPVPTDLSVTSINIEATNGTSAATNIVPPGSFTFLDAVAAGTYVYTVEARTEEATNTVAHCQYVKLVAYEL
jgi:hypothetical protein